MIDPRMDDEPTVDRFADFLWALAIIFLIVSTVWALIEIVLGLKTTTYAVGFMFHFWVNKLELRAALFKRTARKLE
jgi:hypothetical protein